MDIPSFQGRLSADGTFSSCAGCNISSDVDFRTQGILDSKIMATVVLKSVFAAFYIALLAYTFLKMKRVYFLDQPHGTFLGFRETLSWVVLAATLYPALVATREAVGVLKGAFLIAYPVYALLNLVAEIRLTFTFHDFLLCRTRIKMEGRLTEHHYTQVKNVQYILTIVHTLLWLTILARVGLEAKIVADLLGVRDSISNPSFWSDILAYVATAAKSIYLALGLAINMAASMMYRDSRKSNADSRIFGHILMASILYTIWALCALCVIISSAYTHSLSVDNIDLVSVFTYDLPNSLTFLVLVTVATRSNWPYDEWQATGRHPAQAYPGEGVLQGHEAKGYAAANVYESQPSGLHQAPSQAYHPGWSIMDRVGLRKTWQAGYAHQQQVIAQQNMRIQQNMQNSQNPGTFSI